MLREESLAVINELREEIKAKESIYETNKSKQDTLAGWLKKTIKKTK